MANTLEKILSDLGTAMSEFIPRILGALVVMLVALIVAILLQRLATRLLEALNLDELSERTSAADSLRQLGYDGGPSHLLSLILFWAVLISGVAAALSVLGLSSLEQTMAGIVTILGRALIALVIMIAGVMFAGWLGELVARGSERAGLRGSNTFRRVVFVTVVVVSGLVAASQLGLETSILVLIGMVALASLGLVVALALGQGLAPLSGNIAAGRYVKEDLEVGDEISVDGIEGKVDEMGYAAVVIRSEDGYLYRVPNRTLLEGIVRKKA